MSRAKKNRNQLVKKHGFKYTRHYTKERNECFYCGRPADTLDHVPPLSMMDFLDREKRKRDDLPAVLVPCCIECNTALGDRMLSNVYERLLFLECYYDKKLSKLKSFWSEEEIENMGFSFANSLKDRKQLQQIFTEQIRHIQKKQLDPDSFPTFEEYDNGQD